MSKLTNELPMSSFKISAFQSRPRIIEEGLTDL